MRFKMDKSLIPDKGRIVRCSSCGHKWRLVHPDTEPQTKLPSLYNRTEQYESHTPYNNAPNTPNTPEKHHKKKNIQSKLYIPFLITLFIWAIFFITVSLYPKTVVKYIPEMRGLYEVLGIKVEKTGLSLIQPFLEVRNDSEDSSDVLIVRGTIMNTHPSETLTLRPIKLSLRDKANFIVQEFLITQFETEALAPGGIEDFSYEVPNLPDNVIDVEIVLIEE